MTQIRTSSPGASPLLTHPAVRSSPETIIRDILIHDLYRYLDFTVKLEMGPVNQVCNWLAGPNFLPWLPKQMTDDALRIYADEAGHAEMSNTLTRDVIAYSGVTPQSLQPQFLGTLQALRDEWPEPYAVMLQLYFVIVSETLITGTLKRLPGDDTVQDQVRFLAADHASDEGKHHSYFRQLFFILWDRTPQFMQERIASVLPRIIHTFLAPDEAALRGALEAVQHGDLPPDEIVREVVRSEASAQSIAAGAQPTIKMLNQAHVLDIPGIASLFDDYLLSS